MKEKGTEREGERVRKRGEERERKGEGVRKETRKEGADSQADS